MNKTKRFYFANEWFLPPFQSRGYYVEDATGKNVAEAASLGLAKELAQLLNYTAKAHEALKGMK